MYIIPLSFRPLFCHSLHHSYQILKRLPVVYLTYEKLHYSFCVLFCFLWRFSPTWTYSRPVLRLPDNIQLKHTHTHTPEREISQSQKPLPAQHTTNTTDEHWCPLLDSNAGSQQSSGRRPTPWLARQPGSAFIFLVD